MKYSLFLISFFMLIITNLNAQKGNLEIGFHTGVGISHNREQTIVFKDTKPLKTLTGGISFGIGINKNLELVNSLSYETKGEQYSNFPLTDVNGNQVAEGTVSCKINYTTFNILARGLIGVGNNIKLLASGGPYVGYLTNAKLIAKTDRVFNGYNGSFYPGSNIDISSYYKKIDFGVSAGIGVIYPILNKFQLSLEVRRNFGLNNISKYLRALADGKTNSLDVLAGVTFKL